MTDRSGLRQWPGEVTVLDTYISPPRLITCIQICLLFPGCPAQPQEWWLVELRGSFTAEHQDPSAVAAGRYQSGKKRTAPHNVCPAPTPQPYKRGLTSMVLVSVVGWGPRVLVLGFIALLAGQVSVSIVVAESRPVLVALATD